MHPVPPLCSLDGKRVFVAGHRGLVGSALLRRLTFESCEVVVASRDDVDLRRQSAVEAWFGEFEPDIVFVAAGTVPDALGEDARAAELLYDNLQVAANIIEASRKVGVEKLLYLGSAACYPPCGNEPSHEDYLLQGPICATEQWYSLAKIAALRLCAAYRRQWDCDFISCQPANVYGPGGAPRRTPSPLVAELITRAEAAKSQRSRSLTVPACAWWRREFLYVDDLADACVFLMTRYSHDDHINIGWGRDVSMAELAKAVAEVVGFNGDLQFAAVPSHGSARQVLDVSRIDGLGWRPSTPLREGLARTYAWYSDGSPQDFDSASVDNDEPAVHAHAS